MRVAIGVPTATGNVPQTAIQGGVHKAISTWSLFCDVRLVSDCGVCVITVACGKQMSDSDSDSGTEEMELGDTHYVT